MLVLVWYLVLNYANGGTVAVMMPDEATCTRTAAWEAQNQVGWSSRADCIQGAAVVPKAAP